MNVNQICNLIVSTDAGAKDLLQNLKKQPLPKNYKYVYGRALCKSVYESKKYFPEYEKIIELLYDEESEYSVEFINYMDEFLKTLCFLRFFKEFYKILRIFKEGNISSDVKLIARMFPATIKNSLYIGTKAKETWKENLGILFDFVKIILKKTKDFSFIAEHTLKNKVFLHFLKTFEITDLFFQSIDFVNLEIPKDHQSFIKDLAPMIVMLLQFVCFDAAKLFTDFLKGNQILQKQIEVILYWRTLHADEETIGQCMKITAKFISEKRNVIMTQLAILENMINNSLVVFSRKSCEQIVNVFMGILNHLNNACQEFNHYSCCTSIRQHICITIFTCSLRLLVSYLKVDSKEELSVNFQENIGDITDYFLQVMQKFQCPSFDKVIRSIYITFFELSNIVSSESSATFLIVLFGDIFDAEKCQNKLYAAEEIRSFIILYSKVSPESVKKLTPSLEELNALYVGHLLKSKNSKEKIREKIVKYYKETKPTMSVLEVIEKNESHRKPTKFDAELLKIEERNVCLKWFNYMIPKLVENANSDLDYVQVATKGDSVDHERLLNIYTNTLKELCQSNIDNEDKAEKYLTLAFVTKIEVLEQINLLKDKVSFKSGLQEDEFIEAMEAMYPQLSQISLSKETSIIEKARESLSFFVKFHSLSSGTFTKFRIDWCQVTDYINHLSRIFYVRGYSSDRKAAMKFLFKIAEISQNDLTFIQAFSSFLESSTSNSEFDNTIEKQLPKLEEILFDKYMNLESLKSPRTENTVLLCLLNLAFYYYTKNDKEMASSLLEMVKDAIDVKLPHRIGKSDINRFYFHLTRYRILAREKDYSVEGASSLYKEVEDIFYCFKSQVYISSEDSILLPALQFDVIHELFAYHSLRFNSQKLIPFVRLLLTHGFTNGCSLRIIQITSFYSYFQYESECMTRFLAIARIIENIIEKDLLPKDNMLPDDKASSTNVLVAKEPTIVVDLTNDEVSLTVRRDMKRNQFAKKIFIPDDTFSVDAFTEEASKYAPEIKTCLFSIATSYTKFLSDNGTLSVDIYFKKLYEFRKTLNADENPEIQMLFFVLYLNFIRQKSYKINSIKMMTERAARFFKDYSKRLDPGFKLSISSQYFCSQ
ncbi:thr family protein [Megaselia abdita]